ncbi:ROK family transcriptional regulator [Pelosinus propionicus]|uniref:Sugar kinase of the NBD/HSP70 family, may contain an N-terminal HTH domain n=1 Tax=Pelosinus propionicus DSM 13327 TaxID=1123291 RepID=A0A1I4JYE1_9FIRM|nr:ROK family transcriptional regulator [Pelosinus propionicus]SFL71116.1 Sugar kinase of the NBD/HSP70 family, may contain an N-terminal HTH domain [Pelosinus propionicus DSM 13327]
MVKKPGNSKYVKNLNRMTVLNIIKENELVSRQQLAQLTGLTPPAITGIIRELLEMGFVIEVGLGTSQGGRKPMKLKFNAKAGYVIGVEITSHETVLVIADLENAPIHSITLDLDMTEPDIGIPQLIGALGQVRYSEENRNKNFLGIGIAFPGLISAREGIVKRSVNLGPKWRQFPLKETLKNEMKLPIFIESNAKSSALAEWWFGGGISFRNLVYVNLGEGISAGVISADRVIQGAQGHAGEIGHSFMMENGPLCNCGNRGCLEAICGIPALLRKANDELAMINPQDPLKIVWEQTGKIGIEDILKSAKSEGSYSWELLQQVGKYVGLVIANVVNMYNPEAIFIGGKLGGGAETFINPIIDMVNNHSFPEVAKSVQIKISDLGVHSGVIGSCALALRELLHSDSTILEDYQLMLKENSRKYLK